MSSWSDDVPCVSDGYGNSWPLCRPGCGIEVVRIGHVQCPCDDPVRLIRWWQAAESEVERLRSAIIEHRQTGGPTADRRLWASIEVQPDTE